jgi:pyruvate dehydrogenase E2 component (dihydrolipoamide acetyltransferase)
MATPVIMPKLEMTQETATVVAWIRQEGDRVKKGEPLLTIETDKVTIDVESPGSGILAGICAVPDQVVPVTEVIAYVLQPGEQLSENVPVSSLDSSLSPYHRERKQRGTRAVAATPVAQRMAAEHGLDLSVLEGTGPGRRITKADVETALTSLESAEAGMPSSRVRATPAARRIARQRGVDLATIDGSGPWGRVQAADVQAYVPRPAVARRPEAEVVPLRGMRRTIAERMQQSYQTAPHITLTVEVDMSAAESLRRELNVRAEALGVPRISVTAILVKVCAWALQRHRWVNASLRGDEIHLHESANVGVAVALDEGLIVPVVRSAEQLGVAEIASRVGDLIARARQNSLTPADVTGGTFTITNLGMLRIDRFTAIINPPESAILAVGRIAKRTVVVEREAGDEVVVRPMMNMTLSADHRVLDGAVAARFLRDVVDALEHPNLLLW